MAVKPEAQFRQSVHKLLPKHVYRVGMTNEYAGGIPDTYYDGPKTDFWIEWKYLPELPKRDSTIIDLMKQGTPCLSKLQDEWLERRYENSKDEKGFGNVAVALGFGKGRDASIVMFRRPSLWRAKWTRQDLIDFGQSRQAFAELLTRILGYDR